MQCFTDHEADAYASSLGQPTVVACVRALEALVHERTVARLQQESDDPTVGSPRRNAPSETLSYDPASMYLLETMVSIAAKTPQYIDETWCVLYRV
jgi:brefeldin A-resistance guanine nucleotide exchange factor 1